MPDEYPACIACGCGTVDRQTQPLPPRLGGGAVEVLRCADCGLRRALHLPAERVLRREYADEFAAYPKRSPWIEAWHWYRARYAVARTARHFPRGTFVEVGFGPGRMLRCAQTHAEWTVIGVEYSQGAIARMRGEGFDVRYGDLAEAGIEPSSVDVLFASHSTRAYART